MSESNWLGGGRQALASEHSLQGQQSAIAKKMKKKSQLKIRKASEKKKDFPAREILVFHTNQWSHWISQSRPACVGVEIVSNLFFFVDKKSATYRGTNLVRGSFFFRGELLREKETRKLRSMNHERWSNVHGEWGDCVQLTAILDV